MNPDVRVHEEASCFRWVVFVCIARERSFVGGVEELSRGRHVIRIRET